MHQPQVLHYVLEDQNLMSDAILIYILQLILIIEDPLLIIYLHV